jgi:HK97 family phage prohead protease
MKIERREITGLEVRAESGESGTVIAGRGIPYGEWSEDLGGFREQIARGAFRESITDDDVRALFNHNSDLVLGRQSNGTLRLTDTDRGLEYEVDVNEEDVEAMSAVARIRRGDITGNSFGFYIEENEHQSWEERDGMLWRTIHRARLRELGPQTFPAYPQSDVSTRSVDNVLEEAREWLEARGRSTEAERVRLDLDDQDARMVGC